MSRIIWSAALVLYFMGMVRPDCEARFWMPHWGAFCAGVAILAESVSRAVLRWENEISAQGERNRLGLSKDEQNLLAEYRKSQP